MARRKTKTPAEQEAAKRVSDLTAAGLQPEAATLLRHADVEPTRAGEWRAGRQVEGDSVRRLDAVEAIRHGMYKADLASKSRGEEPVYVGCYDAARRFERDIVTSLGLHDQGKPMERVDGSPRESGRLDAMIEASCRVRRVRANISDREWWFWRECFTPTREWPTWRHLAQHVSGETHTHAQAAAVRSYSLNLRDAYSTLERRAAA